MWRSGELMRLDVMWVMKMTAVVISLVLFLYQTTQSLTLFTNSKKTLISSLKDSHDLHFPPLTICVSYPFDPWRLAKFGFDLSLTDYLEIGDNLEKLKGVDGNLTGKQLIEETTWRLGEVVQEVTVGKVKESYTTSTSSSDWWTIAFTDFGPCYRLTPPSVTDLSDKLTMKLREPQGLGACTWVENGLTKQYDFQTDCETVARFCNTTCALEEFKTYIGSVVSLEMTTEGYYASHTLPLYFPLQMPVIELEQYEVYLSSSPALPYDPESCMMQCLSDLLEKEKSCKALNAININEPLRNLCSIIDQYEISRNTSCRQNCSPRRLSQYWRVREKTFESLHLVLTLVSHKVIRIQEVDSFPLSRLLSDIGGNLGLILGISVFSIWVHLPDILKKGWSKTRLQFRPCVLKHFKDHLQQIARYCVICFLLMVMGIHLSEITQSYIQQEKQAVVSLTSSIGSSSGYSDNVSMQDWMTGHLASRAFGCRVEPPNRYELCLQQCFFDVKSSLQPSLLPYTYTNDLAPCSSADLPMLLTYVVPGDLTLAASQRNQMRCEMKCKDRKYDTKIRNGSYPIPKVSFLFPISSIQLSCIIFGVAGLYFGLCFLDLHEVLTKCILMACKYQPFFRMLLVCVASIVGATICLHQVYIYAFHSPVLTATSLSPLAPMDFPALSICPWPPVDIKVLNNDEIINNNIITMSLQEKEQNIQQLMKNKLESGQNMTELWHEMWTLRGHFNCSDFGSYIMKEGRDNGKISATPFGQCYTCAPKPSVEELNRDDNRFHCIRSNLSGVISSQVLVHDPNMVPIFKKTDFNEKFFSVTTYLNSVGIFTTLDLAKDVVSTTCMPDCLYMGILSEFDCQPPFYKTSTMRTMEFNITGCSRFIAHLLQSSSSTDQLFNIVSHEWAEFCNKSCMRAPFYTYNMDLLLNSFHKMIPFKIKSGMKYLVSGEGKFETCVRLSGSITTDHREEFSGYTLTQFLSDMGGVGGFTLGMSLLTLLFKVLPHLEKLTLKRTAVCEE